MLKLISLKKIPEKVCDECKGPDNCPLPEECWSFLPESSVFNLYRGGKKSIELFKSGIYGLNFSFLCIYSTPWIQSLSTILFLLKEIKIRACIFYLH